MKATIVALIMTTVLAGCTFKTVKKCTLGCGEFVLVTRDGVTYARTVDKQTLNVPPYINDRPEKNNEKQFNTC